jgi:predicted outer membrane protein
MKSMLVVLMLCGGAAWSQQPAEDGTSGEALSRGEIIDGSRVIGFMQSANRAAVAAAVAAERRCTDSDVRAFAQHLRTEHEQLGAEVDALATTTALEPADEGSPAEHEAEGLARSLASQEPTAADRAFLDYVARSRAEWVRRADGLMARARDGRISAQLRALRGAAESDRLIAEGLRAERP